MDELRQSGHAHADPDGKGIERACIGIVAFAGLHGRLVQVEHDGDAGHEEQEEHYPELLDAPASPVGLPDEADDAKQQWQAVEHVVALVFLELGGQVFLVADEPVVYEGDARYPVAVFNLPVSLDVVLPSGEVPHEVSPVHPVELVREEELDVLPLCGDVDHDHFATAIVRNLVALDIHPRLVVLCVRGAVHAWEEHVLRVLVLDASGDFDVTVFLVGRGFFLPDELGGFALDARVAVTVFHVEGHLRREGLAVEQGARAVLFAAEVLAQGEDVFRRVLVHRGVGGGAYHDEGVRRVSHDDEHRAEQGGVQRAGADAELFFQLGLRLGAEVEPQEGDDDEADDHSSGSVPVEGDAQHGDAEDERQGHAQGVALHVGLVDAPDEDGGQENDVYQHACVERHPEGVDEEQFEPAAHFHDARHHPVEHDGHEHRRAEQRQERAFGVGMGHFLIIIDKHDGREAEQVEQVHADAEAGQVGDEHQPAVAVRLVGDVLPFEDEPEDHCREQRGEGVDFALDGREPERVAERIGQGSHQAAAHDDRGLGGGDARLVRGHQLAYQVCDRPEEEQDARRAHQRAHVVDHLGHFRRIAGKLRKEVRHEHEERRSGRVAHFQLVAGGDELRAIPEARGRFDGHAIDRGRNEESNPTHQVVYGAVLFHSDVSIVAFFLVSSPVLSGQGGAYGGQR